MPVEAYFVWSPVAPTPFLPWRPLSRTHIPSCIRESAPRAARPTRPLIDNLVFLLSLRFLFSHTFTSVSHHLIILCHGLYFIFQCSSVYHPTSSFSEANTYSFHSGTVSLIDSPVWFAIVVVFLSFLTFFFLLLWFFVFFFPLPQGQETRVQVPKLVKRTLPAAPCYTCQSLC